MILGGGPYTVPDSLPADMQKVAKGTFLHFNKRRHRWEVWGKKRTGGAGRIFTVQGPNGQYRHADRRVIWELAQRMLALQGYRHMDDFIRKLRDDEAAGSEQIEREAKVETKEAMDDGGDYWQNKLHSVHLKSEEMKPIKMTKKKEKKK